VGQKVNKVNKDKLPEGWKQHEATLRELIETDREIGMRKTAEIILPEVKSKIDAYFEVYEQDREKNNRQHVLLFFLVSGLWLLEIVKFIKSLF
jgi:intergrase/recombinase